MRIPLKGLQGEKRSSPCSDDFCCDREKVAFKSTVQPYTGSGEVSHFTASQLAVLARVVNVGHSLS